MADRPESHASRGWWRRQADRRAARALDRQLAYQRKKAVALRGEEAEVIAAMTARSLKVREALARYRPVPAESRVLEVGSGAHGLIFCFESETRVGVDPLAAYYATLFPQWQGNALTVAAAGEALPFKSESFDIVLCDNVVDHARDPRQIIREMGRVLTPGGLLYFTVNVHHPIWQAFSTLHGLWRSLGIGFELAPFADHTVHLTPKAGRALFDDQPLRLLSVNDDIAEARAVRGTTGGSVKRLFFKNALLEIIASKS